MKTNTRIALALYAVSRAIGYAADVFMWRRVKVGLVRFSWGHKWRRWRIVHRTATTVPWAEFGPVDIIFQDNYKKGYKG